MDGKHFSNDEQNDHPLEKESNYMLKNVLHNKIAEKKWNVLLHCFGVPLFLKMIRGNQEWSKNLKL